MGLSLYRRQLLALVCLFWVVGRGQGGYALHCCILFSFSCNPGVWLVPNKI